MQNADSASKIDVTTLGGLRIDAGGDEVVGLPSQPVRCALFLYVALEGAATRDELTALLWPERSAERARHSLSQTLYELKRQLGADCIEVNGERITIASSVLVDALEFLRLADVGRDADALDCFGGAFLDGVHLAASAPFESWVERRRVQLARQLHGVCRRLCEAREAAGDIHGAIDAAQRWIDLEPLDDEAHHRLITLLAAADRRTDALACYERYERRIAEELDIEPLDETKQLVAALRVRSGSSLQQPAVATPVAQAGVQATGRTHASAVVTSDAAASRSVGNATTQGRGWRRAAFAALLVLAVAPLGLYLAGGRGRSTDPRSVAPPGEPTLAVLPFVSLSSDPEQSYLAHGIAEDLLTSLARVDGLRVTSRASAWRFRDSTLAPADVARELDVEYLLTGSVRRDGDRIRVSAQLADVRRDRQLWAETYDGALTGIFELQEDIAQRIADALAPRLTQRDRGRLSAAGTADAVAYDLLLRGREYLNRPGEADVRKFAPAIDLFRQALEADPSYARAHVALSDAYRSHVALPLAMRRDSGLFYARRALGADPELAEAHASLGWSFLVGGSRDSAAAALGRALRLDARSADVLTGMARLEWARGRADEAVVWQRRALAVDPASPGVLTTLGSFLLDMGDLTGAETALRRATRLAPDAPVTSWLLAQVQLLRGEADAADSIMSALAAAAAGHAGADFMLGRYHAQRGRLELAAAQLARPAALLGGVSATVALQRAWVAARLGDERRAAELLDHAEAELGTLARDGYASLRLHAQLAALRGDAATAIALLRRWAVDRGTGDIAAGPQLGFYWLDHDPLFGGLRGEPEFETLLAERRAALDRMRGRPTPAAR